MVEHAHAESSVTIPQAPRPFVTDVPAPSAPRRKAGSKAGLVIGLVVLAIFGVAVVVGGFLIYTKLKPSASPTTTNNPTKPLANTAVEASRYWSMLEPASSKEAPTRVAGLVPIASGQAFQVRFVFPENGYVYIVGPGGDNNEPTAFLTNKPAPETGLSSNEARGGSEFSFPSGDGLLRLDAKPGTDKFTIIFSKTKLESPQFLSAKVVGKPLPPDQLKEFDDFVAKNMQKAPVTELDDSNNQLPYVRVKVDADRVGNPIVFEIRIQHN